MATYFPLLSGAVTPDDRIVLGSIIHTPKYPELSLNYKAVLPIHEDLLEKHNPETKLDFDNAQDRKRKLGLYAKLESLIGTGADVGVSDGRKASGKATAASFQRHSFQPSIDYVNQSLLIDGVKDWIVAKRYQEPVYMITGIIIASNAKRTIGLAGEKEAKGSVTANTGQAPGSLGFEAKYTNQKSTQQSSEVVDDFVFAYRLRELPFRKKKVVWNDKQPYYTKGAEFYGVHDEDVKEDHGENAQKEDVFEPVVGYLAEHDVTASDLGLDALPLVVDGNEVAELVLLTGSESSSG